ncbi:MAG: glycosyltransferase family 39 protein [Candidatus Colwellbacteria bacterium]|nr:glycosyltransferase family 39 protein [Candidatus Colwellbacteria bacterium]
MEKPKKKGVFPWLALAVIIAGSFLLMVRSSSGESAIMDELAHIPAGYGYVAKGDYRLNPEHPPLVKIISALPIAAVGFNFPTNIKAWTTDVNGQWDMGTAFLYHSGNDADKIVGLARIGPMILTLILILMTYIWSKQMMGEKWAIIPTTVIALSPTFLAHGHYVTTDIGAALGVLGATYFFVKSLEKPTAKNIIFAGLFFGIAQLLKFSMVLLVPYFILLAAVYGTAKAIRNGKGHKIKAFFGQAGTQLKNLFFISVIGCALIYPVYFATTKNYPIERQVSDTKFILNSYGGGPNENACKEMKIRCIAETTISMAASPVLRPYAEYILGFLMVSQRASGGNTGYFMGEVSATGWTAYFPVVFLLKEPLPILALAALGLILAVIRILKKPLSTVGKRLVDYLGTNLSEFSMITFIAIYAFVSIRSPLNIGIRHLMPMLPFVYILSIASLKNWSYKHNRVIVVILIAWLGIETAFAAPNYISYFNEIGGGKWNGYRYVTDSNYDWGQDLKRLKNFTEKNNIDRIAVDYFGGGDPEYYLGDKNEPWWSSKGDPRAQDIEWAAISINSIQQAKGKTHEGFYRKPEDEYSWLKNPYEPYAKAGTSIFIYKLVD